MSTIRWPGRAPSDSSTVVSVSDEVSSLLCVGTAGGADGGDGVSAATALQCS